MKPNLLISNTSHNVHALYKAFEVNQAQQTSTGKMCNGGNAFVVLFPLEFISRIILQISELLECLRGRGEQTFECLLLMTGNRLKGITQKIWGMFCSFGVWDIPVVVTTNKP